MPEGRKVKYRKKTYYLVSHMLFTRDEMIRGSNRYHKYENAKKRKK